MLQRDAVLNGAKASLFLPHRLAGKIHVPAGHVHGRGASGGEPPLRSRKLGLKLGLLLDRRGALIDRLGDARQIAHRADRPASGSGGVGRSGELVRGQSILEGLQPGDLLAQNLDALSGGGRRDADRGDAGGDPGASGPAGEDGAEPGSGEPEQRNQDVEIVGQPDDAGGKQPGGAIRLVGATDVAGQPVIGDRECLIDRRDGGGERLLDLRADLLQRLDHHVSSQLAVGAELLQIADRDAQALGEEPAERCLSDSPQFLAAELVGGEAL